MAIPRAKFDRVAETTITTGTGTYNLAGVKAGFVSFNSRLATGDTCYYCCRDGTDWETGLGTFTDATPDTLARTTVIESSISDAAINWGAGSKDIFITMPATRIIDYDGTDVFLAGKMDIGKPGSIQGLDIGEGGSYTDNAAGTTIVKAFSYDASADTGTRFTELTITDNNTLLGDAGDRLYFGSTAKFWAARVEVGVANSASDETFLPFYWNGSALTAMTMMGVLKDSATTLADRIMEQTAEKEYISWDKAIDTDWATADNQTDKIPNTGTALYWTCLQVPVGDLTTAPRIDEIKVRGTDSDFSTGTAQLVHWGKARVGINFGVSAFVERLAANPRVVDTTPSTNTISPLYKLRDSQADGVDAIFRVPHGMDTSCKISVTLDWHTTAATEVDFDLYWAFMTQGTTLGVGVSNTGSSLATLITPSGAAQFQKNDTLATGIDVSSLTPGDLISFTLIRQGGDDTNDGDVFPHELVVHYVEWTLGELV